ncbi:hypothetical protein P692DRAFT_20461071 [Suillus brevipes Sb2]|nr:hypothetical protein P692DRAFT_20461071 [Suillus brevipes Sb2]
MKVSPDDSEYNTCITRPRSFLALQPSQLNVPLRVLRIATNLLVLLSILFLNGVPSPPFSQGCLTPQLYRSHHEQSISRRSFFVRGMFSLPGDWYSTPRFGDPFSGKVSKADRVSMMARKRKPDYWFLPLVDAPSSGRFVPLRVQSTSAHVILALNITFFGIISQSSTVRQCGQATYHLYMISRRSNIQTDLRRPGRMPHQHSIALFCTNYHSSIDSPVCLHGTHSPGCQSSYAMCSSCAYYSSSYFRIGNDVYSKIQPSYRGRLCSNWFCLLFANTPLLSLLMSLGTALNPAWRSPRELTLFQQPSSAWAGANDAQS